VAELGHDPFMSDFPLTPSSSLPPRGEMRRRILAGEPTVGAWINLGSLAAAEIVARSGYDWVVLDLEHGMGGEADIHAQLLAVQGTPTTALVRVPSIERLRIGRALDLGADGLVLPRCDTPADAADALRWMRFPPDGIRGVALLNRGNGYFERTHDTLASAVNPQVLGVFQVESPEAVAAAGDLAAMEGVDVLFVGPADLSHSMGIPGRLDEPEFTAALDAVVAACQSHGKAAGILLAGASFVPAYRERGFSFLGVGSDTGWVSSGAKAEAAAARAALR
jgi:4-hydroxy-2-oxoheptanedioate aldolase